MNKLKTKASAKSRALGRPPKVKPGEKGLRDKIIDVAIDVFARKGIAASSLKEISLGAGATPAVIYYHFGSKENLVETVLDLRLKPLLDNIWAAVDEDDEALDIATAIQGRLIGHAVEFEWFLPLWSREFASDDGSLRQYAGQRLPRKKLRLWLDKIKAAQENNRINAELSPEMVFMSVVGGTLFPLMTRATWINNLKESVSAETVIEHVRAMLIRGLAPAGNEVKRQGAKQGRGAPQPKLR